MLAPRSVLSLLVAVCFVGAACAIDHPPYAAPAGGDVTVGETVVGNYLAARHARSEGRQSDASTFLEAALKQSPDDTVLLARTFTSLLNDGQIDRASDLARQLEKRDERSPLVDLTIIVDDFGNRRTADVVTRMQALPSDSALMAFPGPALHAWALADQGKAEEALTLLDTTDGDRVTGPMVRLHAALIADYAGPSRIDAERRLALLRAAAADRQTLTPRTVILLGGALERNGAVGEARTLYGTYLNNAMQGGDVRAALDASAAGRTPTSDITSAADGAAQALLDGATLHARQGNRDAALAFAQLGLALRPKFATLQLVAGGLLESGENYEDANRHYAMIGPDAPTYTQAQIAIARNLDRLDREDDARALLKELARKRPTDPEPLIEIGDLDRRHDDFAAAVVAYDEAAARIPELRPEHWRLLYARGIALERSKQWPRAEADLLKALEFEPEQPFVLNYLGYSWVEQGVNLERAEAMIRRAVELRPNDGYIVDSLGWVMFRLGRHGEAVEYLERAVELKPEDPVINDHLGDAYLAVGRTREAEYQWRQALDSNPEPDLAQSIDNKLKTAVQRDADARQ